MCICIYVVGCIDDVGCIGYSSRFFFPFFSKLTTNQRHSGVYQSSPHLPFLLFLPFSRVSRPSVQQRVRGPREGRPWRRSRLSLPPSLPPSPSFSLSLSPSLPLFLAGQRLMDIHSNEVKAINNSGGNAHPHLVPFLLKSSVCNKRSSHVNALARSLRHSSAARSITLFRVNQTEMEKRRGRGGEGKLGARKGVRARVCVQEGTCGRGKVSRKGGILLARC